MKPLSQDEITASINSLNTWKVESGALVAEWVFTDFVQAFQFLTAVAIEAEKHQHHPEIQNVYNRVGLRLSTHDAGDKITQKDVDLALAISGLIKE